MNAIQCVRFSLVVIFGLISVASIHSYCTGTVADMRHFAEQLATNETFREGHLYRANDRSLLFLTFAMVNVYSGLNVGLRVYGLYAFGYLGKCFDTFGKPKQVYYLVIMTGIFFLYSLGFVSIPPGELTGHIMLIAIGALVYMAVGWEQRRRAVYHY